MKQFNNENKRTFNKNNSRSRRENDNPFASRGEKRGDSRKPFARKDDDRKPFGERKFSGRKTEEKDDFGERKFLSKSRIGAFDAKGERTRKDSFIDRKVTTRRKSAEEYNPDAKYSKKKQLEFRLSAETGEMRLNRYLANAGVCSRREADAYIQAGVVSVNGQIVTELGTKVGMTDKVKFHDQAVKIERKIYILLNKPKDCVTTVSDPQNRLSVMDLIKDACNERVYPVGRLDKNTTGLLLLTNDGELTAKLTHPKYDKKKIYHATLDKPLETEDFKKIVDGLILEDGEIHADALEYVDNDPTQVGIEIHSGRNRIVRRIFEHLGYEVEKLDRVYFAGLTKKNLPRGKWRFLTEKELIMLSMGSYE